MCWNWQLTAAWPRQERATFHCGALCQSLGQNTCLSLWEDTHEEQLRKNWAWGQWHPGQAASWPVLLQLSKKHQFSTLILSDYWQFSLWGSIWMMRQNSMWLARLTKWERPTLLAWSSLVLPPLWFMKRYPEIEERMLIRGWKHFLVWS